MPAPHEHLGERAARRLVDELDALGWITVGRRAGHQGRHAYTAHRTPLHPVPPVEGGSGLVGPVVDDGSGPDDQDGSLASKEDRSTDRQEQTGVGGSIRRRRGDRSSAVDHLGAHVPDTFGRGDRALRADDQPAPLAPPPANGRYTGPALQLSPRVWAVLAPVRHLLPGIRPFMVRRIARAVGAQLDAGTAPARLTERLAARYAANDQELRDVGRWILGAGLPRRGRHRGCDLPACEAGVIWHDDPGCTACASGDTDHATQACLVCTELYRADQARREQHTTRPPQASSQGPGRRRSGTSAATPPAARPPAPRSTTACAAHAEPQPDERTTDR